MAFARLTCDLALDPLPLEVAPLDLETVGQLARGFQNFPMSPCRRWSGGLLWTLTAPSDHARKANAREGLPVWPARYAALWEERGGHPRRLQATNQANPPPMHLKRSQQPRTILLTPLIVRADCNGARAAEAEGGADVAV